MRKKSKTYELVEASLAKRYAKERRFKMIGLAAIFIGLSFVSILFIDIFSKGHSAFLQTYIQLEVFFDPSVLDPDGKGEKSAIEKADTRQLIRQPLREFFPEVKKRREKKELYSILSSGAGFQVKKMALSDPGLIGKSKNIWLIADDDVDMVIKGYVDRMKPENERVVSDKKLAWIDFLKDKNLIEKKINIDFFTNGDSREPELAGIGSAFIGSFYMILVVLLLSFPIGVAAAIYLEEFAPKNKITDIIEVNINNLAAVPSIVFGLLGLAIFINIFGLPRSASIVGGLVLTLMTLPTIIIASRASLKSVPPSIREAALGVGASRMQTVTHHVLPLAFPGMLTGTIIGLAQALGEAAPLLMIGMVAFIVDVPNGPFDPSTALPVQVFLWADSPERAFVERTSAAIIILLGFLISMNSLAVILRRKFERRW